MRFLSPAIGVLLSLSTCAQSVSNTSVSLQFDKRFAGDTISVVVFPLLAAPIYGWPLNSSLPRKEYIVVLPGNGKTKLQLNISRYAYINISRDYTKSRSVPRPLIDFYLLKRGDAINIQISSDSIYPPKVINVADGNRRQYLLTFAGKGAYRFTWYQWHTDVSMGKINPGDLSKAPDEVFTADGSYNANNRFQAALNCELRELDKYKNLMAQDEFQICLADLAGSFLSEVSRTRMPDPILLEKIKTELFINVIKKWNTVLSGSARSFSKNYGQGIYDIERQLSGFSMELYKHLKTRYSGFLREKLLAQFILKMNGRMENPDSLLKDTQTMVSNPFLKKKIAESTRTYKGMMVFNFDLPDMDGNVVSANSLKDKIVLIDFYYKGCMGCANIYEKSLKATEEKFRDNPDVLFLSVSIDNNKKIWQEAMQSGIYTSLGKPNVINVYTDGRGSDHPFVKYYNIQGYPVLILVKNGKIFEFDGDLQLHLAESIDRALQSN